MQNKCGYCEKYYKKDISPMLSNGYYICKNCAKKQNKKITDYETMAQKENRQKLLKDYINITNTK